jgi:hypothetical protein
LIIRIEVEKGPLIDEKYEEITERDQIISATGSFELQLIWAGK